MGLALLQMQAKAADPDSQPGWVHRRVQQLEFLDTRAVRWRVSVDFVVPANAPSLTLGDRDYYLVPITTMAKTDLVAFSLRDEQDGAVWMPTSAETTFRLASALVYWAAVDLEQRPEDLPARLSDAIWRIVSERPSQLAADPPALLLAARLIDARDSANLASQWLAQAQTQLSTAPPAQRSGLRWLIGRTRRELSTAAKAHQAALDDLASFPADVQDLAIRLMSSANFRSRVEELAQNYVVHVGASSPPGSRRIIKLVYESDVRFQRPRGRFHRLWQNLGWRRWQVDVLIGGRGGSHHLEVAAPAGIDIAGITADLATVSEDHVLKPPVRPPTIVARVRALATIAWWQHLVAWRTKAAYAVPGYAPHVHINPPNCAWLRYRVAIYVRVSRPGWLTASWLISLVIGGVVALGRVDLAALFAKSATGEAGTAATLLLALLGVFATMLVTPGQHPLASRLLLAARLLILLQAGVVLIGVGDLVLHQPSHRMPTELWTALAIVAGAATILFTVSWLFPIAHRPVSHQPRREL